MTTPPALRLPLPALTAEILSLTAKRHPDEGLALLGPLWAASRPGLAQRALLAARIALMRQAMTAAPWVMAVPVVEEPLAEPVFVPAPPPKPVALNKGALTLLNLEDAAKMLMAGGDDDEDAGAVASGAPPAERSAAEAGLADVIAREAAFEAMSDDNLALTVPATGKPKGKKPKAKVAVPVVAQKPAAFDLAAQFADMESPDGAGELSALEVLAGFGAAEAAPLDLSAQFAAMDGGAAAPEDASVTPEAKGKAKPVAFDLSAQFAAMEGE